MTLPLELHWHIAVLVLESSIVDGPSDPSVDVQFRLIRAPDAEAAYDRALALGRKAEHSYENPYGQTCVWTFKGLKDLQEIIEDGVAEDHVVPKERLTAFFPGNLTLDVLAEGDGPSEP